MLEPPDNFHLEAAKGWLDLGDHVLANGELEKITPNLRAHPDVLDVPWQIYAKAEKWGPCSYRGALKTSRSAESSASVE